MFPDLMDDNRARLFYAEAKRATMLGTKLHWVEGPWKGKLAMSARPRGGDWLPDEMDSWQQSGVDLVLSLLEEGEARELELDTEEDEVKRHGMTFLSFPIEDRSVPVSQVELGNLVDLLHRRLNEGRRVVLHCRQGVGRTGLVAACLLVAEGIDVAVAMERLQRARGIAMPETAEQRRWIGHFAESLLRA